MDIHWEAPEFLHHQKTVSWYWITIITAIVILGFAVWQKNFLFGFFIVLAEVLILFAAANEPRMVTFLLNEKGLTIDGKTFYPYSEFLTFSIRPEFDEREGWREIVLHLHKRLQPILKIHASTHDLPTIRKQLLEKTTEVEWDISLLDVIQEFIGL